MNTAHKPRQHNRFKLNTKARVKKLTSNEWIEVRVDSISSMGASFDDTSAFAMNDVIEFFMPKPDGKPPFHLKAKVVWVKDKLVGVEFTGTLAK